MITKTLLAVAALATIGFAAPSFAGEGSPDLSYGNSGMRGAPIYPYTTQREFMVEPAAPSAGGYYEPDYNTGYSRRERRYERYDDDQDFQ